jgi:hypothetical protein
LSINRTTQSLLAAFGVLAAAFGIAQVHRPAAPTTAAAAPVRTVVQSTSLVCPPTLQGVTGSTGYALAAPGAPSGGATGGSATLAELPQADGTPGRTLATASTPGGSTTAKAATGAGAPALVADATGALAPGLTVQQTTTVTDAVDGRGISGTSCTATGTDFWFAGASGAKGRNDVLELTDTETTAASADIQLIGPDGEAENTSAVGVTVPPGGTTALPIAGLVTGGVDGTDLAVHVSVRNGRIAAALHAQNGTNGSDWLPATGEATSAVIPGLPGDTSDARLVVAAPGPTDADLQIQLASQTGWITPAGHETVHVKSGTVSAVDLGNVTRGQPAALRLTPTSGSPAVPIVAGIQVTRSGSGGTDTAFLAGTTPIATRATAAGGSGGDTTLLITSGGTAATVQISAYGTGSPTTKTVTVPAGATVAVPAPQPASGGTYGVSVQPTSGGPVYAARELARSSGGIPMFTVQPLPDDHSTVLVPQSHQDPTIVLSTP